VEERVENLLNGMTLEEKLDYIGGHDEFFIRPLERLGIPAIKMSDGPVGVRNYGPSTAYPGGICLAATWNLKLAAQFGAAIGRDARARGVHIWLAPGVNIHRVPICGRNFEYLGEDPFLAARFAVAVTRNVQQQGVLATIKHFACNNQEYERQNVSSELDERTLREIYLPAFRAAVEEGGAACIMAAYNLVNGAWCTENDFLNNRILKKEWGFDGVLMSDWGATHDALSAARGGLDLEMPSGEFMNRLNLIPAIESGELDVETINDKVRRILRVIVRAGFLDRDQTNESIPVDDPESARVALEIAREGIVLLKNEEHLLPLDATELSTIAVIGANAHPGFPAGGGSSLTEPFHWVSVVEGIRNRTAKKVDVLFHPGIKVPDIRELAAASQFQHEDMDGAVHNGLVAEYFNNLRLEDEPAGQETVPRINFDWNTEYPPGINQRDFSVRWSGLIRPETAGRYIFVSEADYGMIAYLDDDLVIIDRRGHPSRVWFAERELEAGKTYQLKVEYTNQGGTGIARFGWGMMPHDNESPAIDMARKADVAVVCVGFNASLEREGADRSFSLPVGQVELMRAVAAVNPNTVVVLNSGGAVAWDGWLDKVPALLQAWYPGQEGGTAIAEILFGEVNPSGKLPATFEKKFSHNPAYNSYISQDGQTCRYDEGIFVGYRGFDRNKTEPQFCFGHGLSYTTFDYSDMEITDSEKDTEPVLTVRFRIKNGGRRAGAEIAQVYVRERKSRVPRPPKELKAFHKVFLESGETGTVEVILNAEAFMFFDSAAGAWVKGAGEFEILIGSSSRDIRLAQYHLFL